MPWREVTVMNEKILFLADYLRGGHAFKALCQHYGITPKTGYKWVARYQDEGVDGLEERSRRPKASPQRTPYRIRKAILELRERGPEKLGPKKIQVLLAQRFPEESLPSKTTVYNILHAAGLVQPRRRRQRVPPYPLPFQAVEQPNEGFPAPAVGDRLLLLPASVVLGEIRWPGVTPQLRPVPADSGSGWRWCSCC